MPTCTFISFRLGLTDGVSIVAANWVEVMRGLGFEVVTVAGEGPVDRVVPGLEIDGAAPPEPAAVEAALADADLVVVENLCTIPLNLPAARVVAGALAGRAALLHHHDPPWQRAEWAHVTELPPHDPAWHHVTINDLTRRQFEARGLAATTIYNGFDTHGGTGQRDRTRAQLGVEPTELLVAHPVRAIPRKQVPLALALAEQLGATYWLLGDAELGYGPELERILAGARTRVIHRPWPHGPDLYAAPDVVAFPSSWEGFGNPPIEAAIARRPAVVGDYPVARELAALGFRWFDPNDTAGLANWLAHPDPELLDINQQLAEAHFSLEVMGAAIAELLDGAGWLP